VSQFAVPFRYYGGSLVAKTITNEGTFNYSGGSIRGNVENEAGATFHVSGFPFKRIVGFAIAPETARSLGATHTVNPTQGDAKAAIYDILPEGPDLVVEAAGPIEAVKLMVSLLRRGTRWNIFGITTHEEFQLDGGWMHFLEARMDSSFSTNPLAMENSIRLMARGLVSPEKVISHRFPLSQVEKAVETMGSGQRNKVVINP
jgi:threonine dehydrogenase-like Zn-dependent dehydrogenase